MGRSQETAQELTDASCCHGYGWLAQSIALRLGNFNPADATKNEPQTGTTGLRYLDLLPRAIFARACV